MSNKIKLNLEDLAVLSFESSDSPASAGIVHGYATRGGWSCDGTCTETEDYGTCGGNSAGLSACCYSCNCTNNPIDPHCYESDVWCSAANPCDYTVDTSCKY